MRRSFVQNLFYPSEEKFSELSVKERGQIPIIIY